MNTKYNVVENDNTNIEILLLSCNQVLANTNNGLQNTSNFLNALNGGRAKVYENILLTTEISLKVIVKNSQNVVSEKLIFTTDEYNGDGNNATVAQNSLDSAIGKSIIMVDKFLSTN